MWVNMLYTLQKSSGTYFFLKAENLIKTSFVIAFKLEEACLFN